MSVEYTNNITDLTRKALRNGGYEEESIELLSAKVEKVGQQSHHLVVLATFKDGNAHLYLEIDATGNWIAEY